MQEIHSCFGIRCRDSLHPVRARVASACSDIAALARKTDEARLFGLDFVETLEEREPTIVAAQKGWLRVYILYLNREPAAFWMCTSYDGCLQADHAGYDPAWRIFSPETLLFLHIIEDLADQGIKVVDFGCGNSQSQECFADLRRFESGIHIYAPTLYGLLLNVLRISTVIATYCAKIFLLRIRCSQWARKVLGGYMVHQRIRSFHRVLNRPGSQNASLQGGRASASVGTLNHTSVEHAPSATGIS
jgi:Acetyltransferase (GNAT) domain